MTLAGGREGQPLCQGGGWRGNSSRNQPGAAHDKRLRRHQASLTDSLLIARPSLISTKTPRSSTVPSKGTGPATPRDPHQPRHFTAKRAKTAKGPHISENLGDATIQNFPAPLSDSHLTGPEIPGVSLRTNGEAVGTGVLCGSNAMSGINCNVWDQRISPGAWPAPSSRSRQSCGRAIEHQPASMATQVISPVATGSPPGLRPIWKPNGDRLLRTRPHGHLDVEDVAVARRRNASLDVMAVPPRRPRQACVA